MRETKSTVVEVTNECFFTQEHFKTFSASKAASDEFDNERVEVTERLRDLHKLIWPTIVKKGWKIHTHERTLNLTSIPQLNQAPTSTLSSMWLHYGKSPEELRRYHSFSSDQYPQTFVHHMRMQVIVHKNDIGVWLVVGKEAGSLYDRNNITDIIKSNSSALKLYNAVIALGNEYFVDIAGVIRSVGDFKGVDDFIDFVKEDSKTGFNNYFIIGKPFSSNSPALHNDVIGDTVIKEFAKLYPIYDMCKHKM